LKATAAASAQVSKFCFHRAIPGIKLSLHLSVQVRGLLFAVSQYDTFLG